MEHMTTLERSWKESVIKRDEIDRYLNDGRDFINDTLIESLLVRGANPEPAGSAASSGSRSPCRRFFPRKPRRF